MDEVIDYIEEAMLEMNIHGPIQKRLTSIVVEVYSWQAEELAEYLDDVLHGALTIHGKINGVRVTIVWPRQF